MQKCSPFVGTLILGQVLRLILVVLPYKGKKEDQVYFRIPTNNNEKGRFYITDNMLYSTKHGQKTTL